MTLEQLPPGECGRIVSIDAGWGLRRRLEQMGLQLGDLVSVTSRAPFRGPLLVCTRGCQTALGRGVARRIEVSCVSEAPRTNGGRSVRSALHAG
jgi:ferrous iron transport protein A